MDPVYQAILGFLVAGFVADVIACAYVYYNRRRLIPIIRYRLQSVLGIHDIASHVADLSLRVNTLEYNEDGLVENGCSGCNGCEGGCHEE